MQGSGIKRLRGFSTLFHSLRCWLQQRHERSESLRLLMEMDDRMLKDIGLRRSDVHRLYQRKSSTPAHERFEQPEDRDSGVHSSVNSKLGCLSSCSGGNSRTL